MIHVNTNADLVASSKINTQELNDLLRNLNKSEELLYVTFYARNEKFEPKVSKGKDGSFLSVILPYEEVINSDDSLPLLLTHLAKNVNQLKWLDYDMLKEKIEGVLITQSNSDARARRLERAARWEEKCLKQIKHLEKTLEVGSRWSSFFEEEA